MSKKAKIWTLVIVLIVIALGVTGFIFKDKLFSSEDEFGEFDEPIMVETVQMQELGESILVTGKIIPSDEQKVFQEAENGEIKEFLVQENQKIKAGTPLFTYDDTKVNSDYAKAVRARDLTNNRLSISLNELANARKNLTNMKKNPEVSREELNAAAKEINQMEIEIEATKGEVSSYQDEINTLTTQKEKLVVKSKIDGTIVKVNKNVEPGENGANEPIVHIISSGPFKVIGSMSEFDTVKIKQNQAVVIRPKVFKDRTWDGTIESVSHFPEGGDTAGGEDFGGGGGGNVTMYPFKVNIAGDTADLRQGFHVSLEINVSDLEQSEQLAIPHMALVLDEEGNEFVYVLTDEDILEKRTIVLGDMNDMFAGVAEGLELGDRIITNGYIVEAKKLEVGKKVKDYMDANEGMMEDGGMVEDGMIEEEPVDGEEPPAEMEPEAETEGSQNDEAK